MSAGDDGSDGVRGQGLGTWLLLILIDAYRVLLGPLLGGHCRFFPSCSVYASEAIRRHGPRAGVRLSMKRLARCHPFSEGGVDPVP